jgi:hypothetical protein
MGKPQVFWGFSADFYSPIGVWGRGDQWGGGTVLRTDGRHPWQGRLRRSRKRLLLGGCEDPVQFITSLIYIHFL